MSKPLQVIATMKAKAGQADALASLLPDAVARFRKEPGCTGYILLEDKRQSGRFVTYETWTDEAALKAHMSSAAMQELQPQFKALLDGEIQQQFLTVMIDA